MTEDPQEIKKFEDAETAEDLPQDTPVPLVIAIDGPSGSGKSTIAKAVARRVGIGYLDTGAMYRAVTHAAMRSGVALDDSEAVGAIALEVELELSETAVMVNGEDATESIRTPEVTRNVSAVAANPMVRDEMRARQRDWAFFHGGGVMEGRDIGTVVFPNAPLKVYLTASIAERARRRALESGQDPAEVEADMRRRDTADSTRKFAPLTQADDAVVVDTTDLDIAGVVEVIAVHVERVRNNTAAERPAL